MNLRRGAVLATVSCGLCWSWGSGDRRRGALNAPSGVCTPLGAGSGARGRAVGTGQRATRLLLEGKPRTADFIWDSLKPSLPKRASVERVKSQGIRNVLENDRNEQGGVSSP